MYIDLKKQFLDRMKHDLSEKDFALYLDALEKKETHGFTLNLKKLSKSKVDLDFIIKKFDAKLIYKNDNFAYLIYDKESLEKNNVFPGKDPLYHAGLYYIQEPSAAKVLYGVDIKSSDAVLDICASPGGKACEILYNLDKKDGGFLIANEIKSDRAKILLSNIERLGFDNVIVTNNAANDLSEKFPKFFDKIILDAPCSGEGMMRKSEEARKQWSVELVKSCQKLQREIIDESIKMLKSGGIFIYSTCTFSKEEDEENVAYIISNYKDVKLIYMEKNYPFNSIGEGQFFAIFKKGDDDIFYKSKWPEYHYLKGLHILRYGLKKEDVINGRIEPAHGITHIHDYDEIKNKVELNDEEIKKYLHGDVIRKNVEFSGWGMVTYKGLGVGLVKSVNGVLKNHYPKGLRNMI